MLTVADFGFWENWERFLASISDHSRLPKCYTQGTNTPGPMGAPEREQGTCLYFGQRHPIWMCEGAASPWEAAVFPAMYYIYLHISYTYLSRACAFLHNNSNKLHVSHTFKTPYLLSYLYDMYTWHHAVFR